MRLAIALLTMAATTAVAGAGRSQVTPPQVTPSQLSIASLAWLAGSWAGTTGGVEMEEHWMAPKGGAMVGMHRDVAKDRMVSFEFFRIEPRDGKLTYMTSPRGIPAVPFTLVESGPERVVFANPEHDFPQRIIYWKDGADLRARIEGAKSGKTVGEEWRWAPMAK